MDIKNCYLPRLNNGNKRYLNEKELFILYKLLKEKKISSLEDVFFIQEPIITDTRKEKRKDLLKKIENQFQQQKDIQQSPVIFSYLLAIGEEFDKEGFSIKCDANYCLLEGGFLCDENVRGIALQYAEDKFKGKDKSKKYSKLDISQKRFIKKHYEQSKKSFVFQGKKITYSFDVPKKEYIDSILEKKADEDFILLINKLITKENKGYWTKKDFVKFLEIYKRKRKESSEKDDSQIKLSKIIFENLNVVFSIKNTNKLKDFIDKYITSFTKDELNFFSRYGLTGCVYNTNLSLPLELKFFGYKKQKEILLAHINKKYQKYKRADLYIGNPFEKEEDIGELKPNKLVLSFREPELKRDLFLFNHTVIALELEEKIIIKKVIYGEVGLFDLYDRGFFFEILFNYEERNKLLKNFDSKSGILKFAGKEIEISKKGKKTDAVLLLNTLIKADIGEWKHNDEILEEWGYHDEDQDRLPPNKIYFAGRKVNKAVALKTQIEDLVECNTRKARINPKYRKVDE